MYFHDLVQSVFCQMIKLFSHQRCLNQDQDQLYFIYEMRKWTEFDVSVMKNRNIKEDLPPEERQNQFLKVFSASFDSSDRIQARQQAFLHWNHMDPHNMVGVIHNLECFIYIPYS